MAILYKYDNLLPAMITLRRPRHLPALVRYEDCGRVAVRGLASADTGSRLALPLAIEKFSFNIYRSFTPCALSA
jgi:hypothetical protein